MRSEKWLTIIEKEAGKVGHFSVDELFIQMRNAGFRLSRATLYRAIGKLRESGKLAYFTDSPAALYEYRKQGMHHDHFRCEKCGKIIEFCFTDLELLKKRCARRLGVVLSGHALVLVGLCPDCRRKEQK